MGSLSGKKILLGVTGSIAAYKAAELVRLLKDAGADVRVVLTEGGAAFVSPLTFQAVSGQPVHTHLLDATSEAAMDHISLAKWADFILVAPASANFIARLAQGFADDLLTTLCLASSAPIALAPAMNQAMWKNSLTQRNCELLRTANIQLWGPGVGSQACGDQGPGRLLEPADIVAQLTTAFTHSSAVKTLAGKSIVITAGPTQEAIDPVRYLTNRSSGKMGYALAQAAQQAGAQVTLISGPVALPAPANITMIQVASAQQMLEACQTACASCDIFIAAAAVADYRVAHAATEKLKKANASLMLTLEPTIDILATIAQQQPKPFCVGFAAETQQVEKHAQEKLKRKQLDLIIANDVSDTSIGFNSDNNAVTIYSAKTNSKIILSKTAKIKIAEQLIAIIAEQMHSG